MKRRGLSGREAVILLAIAFGLAAVMIFIVWPTLAGVCVWNTTPGSVGQC